MLQSNPDYLILDNPFDNLDTDSQEELKQRLQHIATSTFIIQIISRKADLLPFINTFAKLDNKILRFYDEASSSMGFESGLPFQSDVPPPLQQLDFKGPVLVELRNINVSYLERPILKSIDWTIQKGDFWELKGKNGSGKTTILSMITGENPKGYGQELYIFGQRKGSGESVWDIKKRIGYFTPAMTDKFTGYHSVENMIISGLNDSIGLYAQPTETQLRLSKKWLLLIQMWHLKDTLYHDLSMGQKRLIMCVRAMIKHPVLLILDEPTTGLDDKSALLFTGLVNKFAAESETAIIFVSHRKEPGLKPKSTYELQMTDKGSVGTAK
ncbi:MAG: ABC transporter [Maribacter sp.]|nr:MAG: ABC transporter [Maribacter sp.]